MSCIGRRHPGESRDPGFKPAFKYRFTTWAPAFAGVTALFFSLASFSPVHAKARRPEPGKSDDVYSLTKAEPVPIAAKKTALPLVIFGENPGASSSYAPSGFMGDSSSMRMKSVDFSAPLISSKTGTGCLRVEIKPTGREGWVGLYWQTPANNWGKIKGAGYDLSAAKRLTFWARGEKGGEKISDIKMGGLLGPYPDTDGASLSNVKLKKEWTQYTIDLKGKDLRHIIGGFAFSVRRSDNPRGAVFYLDEIIYEGEVSSAPVVAMAPVPEPTPAATPKLTKPVKILVPFGNPKEVFTGSGKEGLDEIAAVAIAHPETQLLVEGHTDNVGPKSLNKKLGLERARAVADYLVNKGISRDRITTEGVGDEHPIREGSNSTAQGRMENRRVEVTLVPQ